LLTQSAAMDKKPQWFETWFDSPYYPVLYRNRNTEEAQRFIDKLLEYLQPEAGAHVMDLACGRGRHAHHLAQKGLNVVGLDISPKSIQTAQLRYQMPNLEFYVHDMRLPYRINYFDYIFNFFTSIGYFDSLSENQQVFRSVHKGLKKDGRFLVDFMNVDKVINNIVEREEKEIDGIHFYIRRELQDNKILKHIKVSDGQKTALFTESVQVLKPHHFHHFLHQEGFRLIKECGDYQLNAFDNHRSDRYIFLAEKI
jgi:SAM-dependent methyltransferase